MPSFLDARRLRLLASALLIAGLVAYAVLWIRLGLDPAGQFGIDFGDYYLAAQRLARGELPYAPEMLSGSLDAQGIDRYRYPPVLATWLIPFSTLPIAWAELAWFGLQLVAIAGALLLVARRSRVVRGWRDQVLVAGLAFVAFGPIFDALHKGNVSGLLAAAAGVAVVGSTSTAASSIAIVAISKLTPAAWMLPALVAAPRRTVLAAAAVALLFVAPSLLFVDAWSAYPVVLGNMLTGAADYPSNLALGHQLAGLAGADLARALTLLIAAAFAVSALVAARRRDGLPAAMAAAITLSLLVPATMWWHYAAALAAPTLLAVLRARNARMRLLVMAAAAPLAWGGIAGLAAIAVPLLGAACVVALWPDFPSTEAVAQ